MEQELIQYIREHRISIEYICGDCHEFEVDLLSKLSELIDKL